MALLYVGIDEAGYGPLLGPLCVASAAFRVESWREGEPAPDLWTLLSPAVCRAAADKRRRIAVDDSKKLKLANSSVRKHPVYHLERGVLAFLHAGGIGGEDRVESDADFFRRVGARTPGEPWYAGAASPWPVGETAGEIAIASNTLRRALAEAGVGVERLGVEAIFEGQFNELVELTGTKASTTEAGLSAHLSAVWEKWGAMGGEGTGDGVRVVCDRQGGRTQYADVLRGVFPEARVATLVETPARSSYEVAAAGAAGGSGARRIVVTFMPEAETAHLPVALASMLAKLTRESFMARLNRFWCERRPELKPTAGYRQDGWRWLEDLKDLLTDAEREGMIRRA
jgi:hypothetical protein